MKSVAIKKKSNRVNRRYECCKKNSIGSEIAANTMKNNIKPPETGTSKLINPTIKPQSA